MDFQCSLASLDAEQADDFHRLFTVSKLCVDVVVCVLILAGNALTIAALLHQRWCRKETLCPRFKVSSLFVLNLAVADFLIGLSLGFFLVTHHVCSFSEYMMKHRMLCLVKTATFLFSVGISVTTLAAISIDRYVAILHSLRYQEYMTRRRACSIIALTWVVGLMGAGTLFFWNNFEYGRPCLDAVVPRRQMLFIGIPLHVFVITIILGAHLRIQQEIVRMRARRKECEKSIFGAHVQSSSIKSMRAVVLVIGCYVVCYVPLMCMLGTRLMGLRSPALDVAFHCLCTLANFNPMLNPFIYSWKNASVRNALRQFIDKVLLLTGTGAPGGGYLRKHGSTPATSTSGGSGPGPAAPARSDPAVISGRLVLERYVPIDDVI